MGRKMERPLVTVNCMGRKTERPLVTVNCTGHRRLGWNRVEYRYYY